ncbi:OmpA family protein [candidate division KSB1 bacterium]|nr:OmpA family protein [candidate division KSB1 bacterium]
MFQIKRCITLSLIIIVGITTLFVVNAIGQTRVDNATSNDVKTWLFMDTNQARNAAKKAHADILAPRNFGEAMTLYNEAKADFQDGKNLEDIQKKLRTSNSYFQKAIDATKLADVAFPNSMKARLDAQYTESARFSARLWTEAEKKFNEAAVELEDGDVSDARKKADQAEKLYRQAELDAIKANYLDETRELLNQAEQLGVKNDAPETLKLAQQLVEQAELELNKNRYDTDVARSLAMQANYQASHAIYLANVIRKMKDTNQSWEELILGSERPLKRIAEKTDQTALFNTGFGKTTDEIIAYIDTYQDSVYGLKQDLDWTALELKLLRKRNAELEQKLGGKARENSALARQITKQAKTRELFTNVEQSFQREDASVLWDGGTILIRLVGLNFTSAEATIHQQSYRILTKLRNAINSFPDGTVIVSGHTDSYGSDEQNWQLSQKRAEAVKQYILDNTDFNVYQIEAIGYGETRPIASNETESGRAANRRVEVVIHPWKMTEENL